LDGNRRVRPPIAPSVLAENPHAPRPVNAGRVWGVRPLPPRIQARHVGDRRDGALRGAPLPPVTDGAALEEIRLQRPAAAGEAARDDIRLERREVLEELAQCRRWLRRRRAAEVEADLAVIDEVLDYWGERVEG